MAHDGAAYDRLRMCAHRIHDHRQRPSVVATGSVFQRWREEEHARTVASAGLFGLSQAASGPSVNRARSMHLPGVSGDWIDLRRRPRGSSAGASMRSLPFVCAAPKRHYAAGRHAGQSTVPRSLPKRCIALGTDRLELTCDPEALGAAILVTTCRRGRCRQACRRDSRELRH